jgi:hypothetical protein
MRRAIILIFGALLICGIAVAVRSIRSNRSQRTISLCEVARDPAKYDQQIIRVRASGWVTSSDIYRDASIFDLSCGTSAAAASIELDESYNPASEVYAFLNYPKEEIRKADVVVLGKFDQWASQGCFTPQFGIRATSIELVSPVTSEPLPKREVAAEAR